METWMGEPHAKQKSGLLEEMEISVEREMVSKRGDAAHVVWAVWWCVGICVGGRGVIFAATY